MKVESLSSGILPLQNSNSMRTATEEKTVVQDRELHQPHHDQKPAEIHIESVMEKLNEMLEPFKTNLKFEFHEKLNEYYVTIIDSSTNEVLKEIPPKKILDMYAAMGELMGFIMDKKI